LAADACRWRFARFETRAIAWRPMGQDPGCWIRIFVEISEMRLTRLRQRCFSSMKMVARLLRQHGGHERLGCLLRRIFRRILFFLKLRRYSADEVRRDSLRGARWNSDRYQAFADWARRARRESSVKSSRRLRSTLPVEWKMMRTTGAVKGAQRGLEEEDSEPAEETADATEASSASVEPDTKVNFFA
jgi:hypothetical protein